jgi:hypothetical protein
MSWSFSSKGTPDVVAKAAEDYGATLSGQSKLEFDEALPHMVGLIRQTFESRPDRKAPTIQVNAFGSGSAQGDQQLERSCSFTIARTS